MRYYNPVIRGFYPDPSVCYAEGCFYLVCSSFHYFPGIPLFKSKNMIDWELIGHCLTRKSQLNLTGAVASEGLFAPTIRYHDGRFYMVVTNQSGGGNFYVYTDDIEGEWSDPIFVQQTGIDPSLLFDQDKVYFTSNGSDENGVPAIFQCEIDIETGALLTESKIISYGTGGRYVEAPHLYRIEDYYYLLLAEGGTEYGHTATMLRSKSPYGPFESCPHNPVLTNRHLGGYFIQGAGHGDLTVDEQGKWWMVHLAFRQIGRYRQFHHLGREVFLAPVSWTEDGWIRVGTDGTSRGAFQVENGNCRALPEEEPRHQTWAVNEKEACYLRSPNEELYQLTSKDIFRLKGSLDTLDGQGNPTFLGMRQQEFDCLTECVLKGDSMLVGQEAGLTVYMNEQHRYDLCVCKEEEAYKITLKPIIGGLQMQAREIMVSNPDIKLKILSTAEEYIFFAEGQDRNEFELGRAESKFLSSEVAEGFTGVIIAAYCIANREGNSGWVEFINK